MDSKEKRYLQGLQGSYTRVFNTQDEDVKDVLSDLALFCRAHESAFDPDPRAHALKEGRREVFLKIQQYLNLSSEELWELFQRRRYGNAATRQHSE